MQIALKMDTHLAKKYDHFFVIAGFMGAAIE